jgi:hypothetical protein
MGESGNLLGNIFLMPRRNRNGGRVQPIAAGKSTDGGESARSETVITPAEMRWKVLHSLPKRHQGYVYEAIRERCAEYLGTQTFPITDRELVSQVWIKILARLE